MWCFYICDINKLQGYSLIKKPLYIKKNIRMEVQLYGSKYHIIHHGYVDFLGAEQYNIQQYYVLRKFENEKFLFKKTVSEGKANALQLMGWELIKTKGSNHVDEPYKEVIEHI